MPAGGLGVSSPACASTNAPVPSVTFALPGSQQRRPNSDACWSPIAARTGTPAISASIASESTIGGSSARGMPNSSSSSSSQSPPPSGHRSERAALPASVTWTPPRRASSQRGDVAVGQVLALVDARRAATGASSRGTWRRARARCARAPALGVLAQRVRRRRRCGGPATRSPGARGAATRAPRPRTSRSGSRSRARRRRPAPRPPRPARRRSPAPPRRRAPPRPARPGRRPGTRS